ncbi:hypothetical protein [Candidatus Palauibacter sp.]|uniref:hypothetical protein n=1 Tax=Candidatus Palauibacter sp. TaxID=3101350 RepID=UPI003AF1F945
MYTTCIFCHGDLHRNEAIEEFPVGRRLAFDGSKGRFWVVCRRCERWNLSPLETRWEAIEACERAFETTRMRVASDNIGLAKLKEGLELVRVGDPVRQEFAAWRYGDQFGRRRRRAMLITGAGVTAVGAIVAGGMFAGVSMAFVGSWGHMIGAWQQRRVVLRTRDEAGDPIRIQRKHLYTSRLVPGEDATGWDLQVDHLPGWGNRDRTGKRKNQRHTMIVRGSEAIGLAGQLMARANHWGGARKSIQAAVARIETAGHPEAFLPQAAEMAFRDFRHSGKTNLSSKKIENLSKPIPGSLAGLKVDMRLAIEMATHEQAERAALEGELKELEARWREAEEIARIADNLFVPESVDSFIAGARSQVDPQAPDTYRSDPASGTPGRQQDWSP